MQVPDQPDPHDPNNNHQKVTCYVCNTDITNYVQKADKGEKDSKKKATTAERLKSGLVEIRTEGTGFAGGGKNVVKKEGVVFQC